MDKLDSISPGLQAVDIAETGFSVNDVFNPDLVNAAVDMARQNPRKRMIVRIHENLSDENHLMVNAILGESYVPPHKHEEGEKTETFRIVKGRAFIVFFDDSGKIENKVEMNDTLDGRKIVTVRPGKWHTFVPMSEETVVLEAKRQPAGGYSATTDKTMAPWAPPQENAEAGQEYLRNLVASLDEKRQ